MRFFLTFIFRSTANQIKVAIKFSRFSYARSFGTAFTFFFVYNLFMEFLNDLWNNQPNTIIGVSVAILVLLGIYIKLLFICQ